MMKEIITLITPQNFAFVVVIILLFQHTRALDRLGDKLQIYTRGIEDGVERMERNVCQSLERLALNIAILVYKNGGRSKERPLKHNKKDEDNEKTPV